MNTTAQLRVMIGLVIAFSSIPGNAQDTASSRVVDIFWHESTTVQITGLTNVVVLDDSISRAEISNQKVQFVGLQRGETIAFAWIGDERITLRLRVTARPIKQTVRGNALSSGALEAAGNGILGSSVQMAVGPRGDLNSFFTHRVDWQQLKDGSRLGIHGQAQDSATTGLPRFNMNSISVSYETSRSKLLLMDFPLEINGGSEEKVSMYSAYNVYPIRGGSLTRQGGANKYEFFGGTTIPSYFRTLTGTRSIAGLNVTRKQSATLSLYSTMGWVNSPISGDLSTVQRRNTAFETAGFAYRPNSLWAVQATAGASTRGLLAQGTVSYSGTRLTTFLSGTRSSADFPLNQLQLVYSGGSSVSAGTTVHINRRISSSLFFQYSQNGASIFSPVRAASGYYSSNLNFAMTTRQSITFNHTYSRSVQGNAQASSEPMNNQRFDLSYNVLLGGRISNTAQFVVGSLSDPAHLNSRGEYNIREALSIPLWTVGSITVGVQHTHLDPSLVTRLNQEISLLAPDVQQLFLLNPSGFVQSADLPDTVRALLQGFKPSDTQITLSGQFHAGRLSVSPNVGFSRNVANLQGVSKSQLFGYSLSYEITPKLQLTSSFSNVLFLDPSTRNIQQTSVASFGVVKSFSGVPRWLDRMDSQKATIRGRVFRDLNLDGVYTPGEPGLSGVRVELNRDKSTLTDADGRFEFPGLNPGFYQTRLPVSQFDQAIRLTSPAEGQADLNEDRTAQINFGVVNFARLTGNVYNDYLMAGPRQPDANGLPNIRLTLTGNGVTRELTTDGSGDYGLFDILPGDYELSVDRATVPANFLAPEEPLHIHIAPVTSVVQDIPVHALRSLSGHVYMRRKQMTPGTATEGTANDEELQPLPGVQLQIRDIVAITDADGSFVLRNLPAGELFLNIIPARQLPDGLKAPVGKVKFPREPIHVEEARIVISNPELPQYLTPVASR